MGGLLEFQFDYKPTVNVKQLKILNQNIYLDEKLD